MTTNNIIIDHDSELHQIIKIDEGWELRGKRAGKTYFMARSMYKSALYVTINMMRKRKNLELV